MVRPSPKSMACMNSTSSSSVAPSTVMEVSPCLMAKLYSSTIWSGVVSGAAVPPRPASASPVSPASTPISVAFVPAAMVFAAAAAISSAVGPSGSLVASARANVSRLISACRSLIISCFAAIWFSGRLFAAWSAVLRLS